MSGHLSSSSSIVAAPSGCPSGSRSVIGVQWISGLDDRLMTWSTELKLYRTRPGNLALEIGGACNGLTGFYGSAAALDEDNNRVQMSPDTVAELECQIPEPPHYIRCAEVHPADGSSSGDVRFAVGQASGKVTLMSFDEVNHEVGRSHPHVIKDFGPRVAPGRVCNDLAWNLKRTNLLAAGYDKSRHDAAILVFDTTATPPFLTSSTASASVTPSGSSSQLYSQQQQQQWRKSESIPAVTEIGMGDTCHSLSWFVDQPDSLVCGVNNRSLKVYDVRAAGGDVRGKAAMTNYTRAVHGVCVDPWLDYRVASFNENQVTIWDTRNFGSPIVTKSQVRKVAKLAWSPTRSGLLASIVDNAKIIRLHDIQSWAVMSEDGESPVTDREVRCYRPDGGYIDDDDSHSSSSSSLSEISSFAWHPRQEHDLVCVLKSGRLSRCVVPERMTPAWSQAQTLVWPNAGTLRMFDDDSGAAGGRSHHPIYNHVQDISVLIRDRAERMVYNNRISHQSLQEDLDSATLEAWKWVEKCRGLMQDLSFKNQFPRSTTYPGVRTALGLDRHHQQHSGSSTGGGKAASSAGESSSSHQQLSLGSDVTYSQWNATYGCTNSTNNMMMMMGEDSNQVRLKRIYKGAARERTLRICGWGSDDPELKRFLGELEERGEFSRAAAIAIFCLQIRTATQILQRGGKSGGGGGADLSVVAMALSGFSEERSGALWRDSVAASSQNMSDPYLRSMFTFLLAISAAASGSSNNNNAGAGQTTAATAVGLDQVLKEQIKTSDRVGFCCLHLSDSKLISFVNECWREVLEVGDLSGFYLCGGSSQESVALLQRVVDLTADVQLASWMAVKTLTVELARSEAPQLWISAYKNILDSWRHFKARAELDNAISAAGIATNAEYQVYIACSYCNASICRSDSQIMKHLTVGGSAAAAGSVAGTPGGKPDFRQRPGNMSKELHHQQQAFASSSSSTTTARYTSATTACSQGNIRAEMCPSCRKPLPRCAVCFINMGTLSGLIRKNGGGGKQQQPISNDPLSSNNKKGNQLQNSGNRNTNRKLTSFDNFFTWCQSCHHGGHARHIIDWFKDHVRCPAFKCGCKCASLDPATQLAKVSIKNSKTAAAAAAAANESASADQLIMPPAAASPKDKSFVNGVGAAAGFE